MDYTHEYSNFPNELVKLHNYKNVDDTVGVLVAEINSLRNENKYSEAAALIEANKYKLAPYIFDAIAINTLIEEIRNTQIKAISTSQFIFFSDKEVACVEGDVWIGSEV